MDGPTTPQARPRVAWARGWGRRPLVVAALFLALAAPAALLRATCSWGTCPTATAGATQVPFCSLPEDVRTRLAEGFRDDRSPEVLLVSAEPVQGATRGGAAQSVPWSNVDGGREQARVPLVFIGAGVAGGDLPDGARLDAVAPTLADQLGLEWPQARRSGRPIEGVLAGPAPRLVLLVAWEGLGSADLEASPRDWPALRSAMSRGAGTLEADTGSLPVDPVAVLTTIGTGGLPSDHGIVGELLRSPYDGTLARALGRNRPPAAIPTLADELDRSRKGRSLVGLAASSDAAVGLVGGEFYVGGDRDLHAFRPPAAVGRAAVDMVGRGFGRDGVPDVLGVVLRGPPERVDADTGRILRAAEAASGGSFVAVVAGTGRWASPGTQSAGDVAGDLFERLPAARGAVEAIGPGGVFLSATSAGTGVTSQRLVDTLLAVRGSGGPVLADAFPSFAVSLRRYC